MSIIAWDGKMLVADKQSTGGQQSCTVTKIFRVPQGLIGVTGNTSHMMPLLAWFQNLCMPELYPKFQAGENNSQVLHIDKQKRIWLYADQPEPFQIEQPYYAIGSGNDIAMGAMMAGADARRAVDIACYLNIYCGMGVDSLTLET